MIFFEWEIALMKNIRSYKLIRIYMSSYFSVELYFIQRSFKLIEKLKKETSEAERLTRYESCYVPIIEPREKKTTQNISRKSLFSSCA